MIGPLTYLWAKLPMLSLRMTGVFHEANRPIAKARELVTCSGAMALAGGLKGGLFQLDTFKIELTLAGFSKCNAFFLLP